MKCIEQVSVYTSITAQVVSIFDKTGMLYVQLLTEKHM